MTQQTIDARMEIAPHLLSRDKLHFAYVDGFRGLAALYVVLHHAVLMTWLTENHRPAMGASETFFTSLLLHGDSAVTFFIAISGFCLMLPLVRSQASFGIQEAKRFFYRRAWRILPPYYFALLLSLALTTVYVSDVHRCSGGRFEPTTFAGIVSHLLLVQNLDDSTIYQVNGPMWSIAVECQIYLVFPLLVTLRRSLGLPAMLGAVYIIAVLVRSLLIGTPYGGLMPMYLFVFALGMSAAEIAMKPPRQLFVWMGCAATALVLAMFVYPGAQQIAEIDTAVGLCSMCLLIVGAHWPQSAIAHFAGWRPVAFVGTFSYSLYLVHSPLQQVLWNWLFISLKIGAAWTFALGATLGTALILLFSYWFHVFAERPFCTNTHSQSALQ